MYGLSGVGRSSWNTEKAAACKGSISSSHVLGCLAGLVHISHLNLMVQTQILEMHLGNIMKIRVRSTRRS